MKTIKDLTDIGFEEVGYWFIDERTNKLDYNIYEENLSKNHLLYAFESNSIIKYIGITEKTLKERMNWYKSGHNPTAGSTNQKVYNKIFETLTNGYKVNIFILKDSAPCTYKGYEISLATGIEKSLIKAFSLKESLWNTRGTVQKHNNIKGVKKKTEKGEKETILKLNKEAMKGWLIFRKDMENFLPPKSGHMDIHYKSTTIKGCRFTWSFHNKKTNGGYKLKEIFENDFKIEDSIKVTILNLNEVRFEKFNR